MAELSEKCKTCKKAFHIWRWGIHGSCPDDECQYEKINDSFTIEPAGSANENGFTTV